MSNETNKPEADFVYERQTKNINEVVDENSDPVLVGDPYLGADIGLNTLDKTADRSDIVLGSPAPERDDLLESDAIIVAEAAGLTGNVIDYAEDEDTYEDNEALEDEVLPLEDIPDADEIEPGSAVDPASPPVDVMPGTDVINGSQGE